MGDANGNMDALGVYNVCLLQFKTILLTFVVSGLNLEYV